MNERKPEFKDRSQKRDLWNILGMPKQFYWQIIFAGCLILMFTSVFSFFLEGKSSYDLGFTLWDDRFAKVLFGNMGEVIMPQTLFYGIFFLITTLCVVILIKSRSIRQITTGILIITAVIFLIFISYYGIVLQTYLGSRQGPAGWLILELPWLSLILLCLTLSLGVVAFWMIIYPDLPNLERSNNRKISIKNWLIWVSRMNIRVLVIISLVLGGLFLNAALILLINNINVVFFIGVIALVISTGILFYKKDLFSANIHERQEIKARKKPIVKGRRFHLFKRNDLKALDRKIIKGNFAFNLNPRNSVWRAIRKWLNSIFSLVCLGFMVSICYMTVPDEWVFLRFFDLLPWVILGIVISLGVMTILPEPALFFPLTLIYFLDTYYAFLEDYNLPFNAEFIMINGIILGFWVGTLLISQNYMYRTKSKGRNMFSMGVMTLSFWFSFLMITLIDRFQHSDDMVQKVITEVLDILIPILIYAGYIFLGLTLLFWGIDIAYRFYRSKKPLILSNPPTKPEKIVKRTKIPLRNRLIKARVNLSEKNKKILALACIGIMVISFISVEIIFVNNSHIHPMLIRNEDFGVWTVSGVTKVEKHYPIQMPSVVPMKSEVEISAARGEWEGWHLLVSPQPGKRIILSDIYWTDFIHTLSLDQIPANTTETFLVDYLVDEQPDVLLELPETITRNAGEHIDLFCRVQVPRNATAGIYTSTFTLIINDNNYQVYVSLNVFNFTMPLDRHLRNAFGGGWQTDQWYDELEYLRISQYDMGIPFEEGEDNQYWWNKNLQEFEFNWTAYDSAFQAQLERGFTGIRQGYFPKRPSNITDDDQWALVEKWFLSNVSAHLESHTWLDELGGNHSWVEIPYNYWTDEPDTSEYEKIKEKNDRYHAGSPKLRTLLTEEFRQEFPILHDCVNIWCPVIGNFEPSAVENRHKAGQEYWFYVCVAPTAPYPNLMLWEAGHNPRLLPLIAARFNVDGFLYWRMTAGNNTYRAGFEGNGDGQVAFEDPNTGRPLPSLRLLSFSSGVEDFEYIWLLRKTLENQTKTGSIPSSLLSRAEALEARINAFFGERAQFVNHDAGILLELREDLALLLEDLWPYTQKLY